MDDGVTVIDDVVRGRTEFPNIALEDVVIAGGNRTLVFILAIAVDDIRERITPRHPRRGAPAPVWGHLSVTVNEKRQKLSKRRDKAEGYLPEAMANYLMLLGWGPGDNIEIRRLPGLAVKRCHPSAHLRDRFIVRYALYVPFRSCTSRSHTCRPPSSLMLHSAGRGLPPRAVAHSG